MKKQRTTVRVWAEFEDQRITTTVHGFNQGVMKIDFDVDDPQLSCYEKNNKIHSIKTAIVIEFSEFTRFVYLLNAAELSIYSPKCCGLEPS